MNQPKENKRKYYHKVGCCFVLFSAEPSEAVVEIFFFFKYIDLETSSLLHNASK